MTGKDKAAKKIQVCSAKMDFALGQKMLIKLLYVERNNNLNLQCMFYFSDHGENLKTGHGPSDKDFVKVRIPVMIYTSPEYRKNNPELCTALYQHKENFFTNDMMYNTICGMLKAKSNFYDAREDLSTLDFAYHKDDLYTFCKKAKVIDDPALQ